MNRGTLVRYKDGSGQCWSRVDTVNGDNVWISITQSGLLIKNSNFGLFGKKLFEEKDVDLAAQIVMNVALFLAPEARDACASGSFDTFVSLVEDSQDLPADIKDPTLRTLTWASMNFSSVQSLAFFFAQSELRLPWAEFLDVCEKRGW